MRDGLTIIDTDTHVWPSVEVLKRYADQALLDRWDAELAHYERRVELPLTYGDPDGPWTNLSIEPRGYLREIGEKSQHEEELGAGGRAALEGKIRGLVVTEDSPRYGVGHDNAEGRIADMDREGTDVHLLIPGTWPQSVTVCPTDVGTGLYESYQRYMTDFCSIDTGRLKSLLMLTGEDVEWSVRHIKEHGDGPSVAGAMLALAEGYPIDDPDLEPIWAALADADLPLLHHSFFYEPPYFPGYRDVWDNIVVART
ncbi:MAG: amidohydrolase family protein, partial [Acidimicrobiaceae bacterium]|nr:amidohydrolase family protein [Acidimicrobiaceae bacterium]